MASLLIIAVDTHKEPEMTFVSKEQVKGAVILRKCTPQEALAWLRSEPTPAELADAQRFLSKKVARLSKSEITPRGLALNLRAWEVAYANDPRNRDYIQKKFRGGRDHNSIS